MTRDQLGKFALCLDRRNFICLQKRQLVHHFRQELAVSPEDSVQTPDGIGRRLVTNDDFVGERLFIHVQNRTTQLEILAQRQVKTRTHHRFGIDPKKGIRFEGHLQFLARSQHALVQNHHLTNGVIDLIVNTFLERDAVCRHLDGPRCDVDRVQGNFGTTASLIGPFQKVAVFVGRIVNRVLLCSRIQGVKDIFVHVFGHVTQFGPQVITKRLQFGEDDHALVRNDRDAVDVVKKVVWTRLVVVLEGVQAKNLNQRDIFDRTGRQITDVTGLTP